MNTTKKETTDEHGRRVIEEFNSQNQLIEQTCFCLNGYTVQYILEYNPNTKRRIKFISFRDVVHSISEFDPNTSHATKSTYFEENGKTVAYINEHDTKTGEIIEWHDSDSDYVKNEQKKYKRKQESKYDSKTKTVITSFYDKNGEFVKKNTKKQ